MSDSVNDRPILPFGLKDTKQGSQLDQNKISAFQVAPTRKTAFEKSREEAQRKAEREAAETAAAYQDFVAEYGETETDKKSSSSHRSHPQSRNFDEARSNADYRHDQQRKRSRQEPVIDNNHNRHDQHDSDSETEERERRRIKLKSSSNFLDELKQNNRRHSVQRAPYRENDRPAHIANAKVHPPKSELPRDLDRARQDVEEKTSINEDEDESGDDVDYYRARSTPMVADRPLNKIHRARLKFLLDTTTAKRGSIARMTAFAMTHASSVVEIAKRICDSVAEPGVDWKISVARLWCVSDILHNSWVPIPNVWKYRSAFEDLLEVVAQDMLRLGETIESRIRRENYRRLVTGVLDVWNTWICFSNGFVDKLFDAFDDTPEVQETVVEAQKEEKKGGGWKKLGDTSQADSPKNLTDTKMTNEAPRNLDGDVVDLDGQDFDLDGEELDLDGEECELDDPESTVPEILAPLTLPVVEPPIVTTVEDESDKPKTSGRPLPSTSTKVKMSFGKFTIPKKPVAVVVHDPPPTINTIENDLQEYERLAAEAVTDSTERHDQVPQLTGVVGSDKKARPGRRSAADFMD